MALPIDDAPVHTIMSTTTFTTLSSSSKSFGGVRVDAPIKDDQSINTVNPLSSEPDFSVPNANSLARANKVMDSALSTGLLSTAGWAFLKLATDPWHDNKVPEFRGVPDVNEGNSVICSVMQELSISKPGALAAGNWNVRITTNPVARSVTMWDNVCYTNTSQNWNETALTMIPIQVDFSSGSADFPDYSTAATSTGLSIPAAYLNGPYKVVALGIEVCNTTAVLYQQGLCTCCTMNQSNYEPFTMNLNRGGSPRPQPKATSVVATRTAPKNISEAILMPGVTQWHAREGHYSVVELLQMQNLAPTVQPVYPIWLNADLPTSDTTYSAYLPAMTTQTLNGVAHDVILGMPGRVPMNTTTAMYTGLSDQTTLTLRVRWIIERYPNDNQPEILVLATPSPSLDQVAMEIYSTVMSRLPSAVMFKYNNSTDWWKGVLGQIADVVSSGLLMMPHPLAKGAGAAIGMMRSLTANKSVVDSLAEIKSTEKTLRKERKKKKAQAKPRSVIVYDRPLPPTPKTRPKR